MLEVDEGRRRSVQAAGLALLGAVLGPGLTACAYGNASARATAPCAAMPWQLDADFLADLPRLMRAYQVPGVAMALVDGGELVWSQQLGFANAQTQAPLQADSVFEAASLSKPMFAWLVLRLVDAKLFDLEQPLTQSLRPSWLADDPALDLITARDVLRHSTGLVNWRSHPMTEKLQPAFRPGSQVSYSGEAYFWLQLVLEQVTGDSLDTLMQRYLFAPAGMHDSSYGWSRAFAERSVFGHAAPGVAAVSSLPTQTLREQWQQVLPLAESWQRPLAQWRYADAERAYALIRNTAPAGLINWPGDVMANAAASLRCTVTDYARFMAVMLQAPAVQSATQFTTQWISQSAMHSTARANKPTMSPTLPKLSETSHRLMTTVQIETRPEWSGKSLGWNIERTATGPVFYHGGNNGNMFKTFALGDLPRQRALVVMTNGGGGSTVYQHIARAATGLDLLAFEP